MEEKKIYKKTLIGIVTSDKMSKSIVVKVTTKLKHPKYIKYIHKNKKFKAHDEHNKCKVGDLVKIIECRPISKEKRFRLLEILETAQK